jgi:hypothetical protein
MHLQSCVCDLRMVVRVLRLVHPFNDEDVDNGPRFIPLQSDRPVADMHGPKSITDIPGLAESCSDHVTIMLVYREVQIVRTEAMIRARCR